MHTLRDCFRVPMTARLRRANMRSPALEPKYRTARQDLWGEDLPYGSTHIRTYAPTHLRATDYAAVLRVTRIPARVARVMSILRLDFRHVAHAERRRCGTQKDGGAVSMSVRCIPTSLRESDERIVWAKQVAHPT